MIITEAQILGRNRKILWLRIPWLADTHRILTLEDSWLPRGAKTARFIKIEYDPKSIRPRSDEDGWYSGWTGDVELLDVIDRYGRTEEDQSPN